MGCMTKYGRKGSLTVEASIAFPVFLCFFLLLIFFIRLACANIVLNHAVNETAKQLATSCYPVVFLNELEDELIEEDPDYTILSYEEEKKRIGDYIKNGFASEDMLANVISGQLKPDDVTGIINGIIKNVTEDIKGGIRGYATSRYAEGYFNIKTKAKYTAVKYLIDKFNEGSFVNSENLEFVLVELPQGNAEFNAKTRHEAYMKIYDELGCKPNPNNVVIAVEYSVRIPIPFFSDRKIITRHIAVERAWLYGSNGVYTIRDGSGRDSEGSIDEEEGSDSGEELDGEKKLVYVTKTGRKYHEEGCEYLEKSRRPIRLEDAMAKGYNPCKVCILKTAEYVWK